MTRRRCPCCGDVMKPSPGFEQWPHGHHPMTINYRCPDCDAEWEDEWCSAIDADCPECDARDVEPLYWSTWPEYRDDA